MTSQKKSNLGFKFPSNMFTKKKIKQIIFAQFLAIALVMGHKGSEKLNEKEFWFPLQDFGRIIFIFVLSSCIIYFKRKLKILENVRKIDYFFCVVSDFLGNFFLKLAFSSTIGYLVVFISQLMYPMTVIVMKILYNRNPNISLIKIIAFVIILATVLMINAKSHVKIPKSYIKGIIYACLSNLCFIANILLQNKIVDKTGPFPYLQKMSAISFLMCPFISCFTQFKCIPRSFYSIKNFYTQNWSYCILSNIGLAALYVIGTIYIEKYGPVRFNIGLLGTSVYFGLISLVYNFDFVLFSAYLLVFIAVIILLCTEMK